MRSNMKIFRSICFIFGMFVLGKGQLISKCPFGVIVSTKIPTEKFEKFCPRMGRAEFVKFFRWYFGQNDDTKRTF